MGCHLLRKRGKGTPCFVPILTETGKSLKIHDVAYKVSRKSHVVTYKYTYIHTLHIHDAVSAVYGWRDSASDNVRRQPLHRRSPHGIALWLQSSNVFLLQLYVACRMKQKFNNNIAEKWRWRGIVLFWRLFLGPPSERGLRVLMHFQPRRECFVIMF